MSTCPDCQGRSYQIVRQSAFAHARVCRCARPCPKCGDLGYVYENREQTFSEKVGARTYEVLVPCSCRLRVRRVQSFNAAKLPSSVGHATFENFKPAVPEQGRALKAAQAFAYGYSSKIPSRGFVLGGPVGAGKTHLIAAALAHVILESGARAAYVEISLLYATIRRGFQDGKSGGEIIGPLSEVEVLAIDEIGKGRGSPFEMETLDELIARRYNAGRTTLFATNYSLAPEKRVTSVRTAPAGYRSSAEHKEAAKDSELLRERVGERIYSRLCEMCEFVELPPSTPDQRRMRHEMMR
ncbi:MAG: ATP-binding protein [Myxococcaceae bacterium]